MRELHQRGPGLTFDGGMYWYEMRGRKKEGARERGSEGARERGSEGRREEITRRILCSLFLSHLSFSFHTVTSQIGFDFIEKRTMCVVPAALPIFI